MRREILYTEEKKKKNIGKNDKEKRRLKKLLKNLRTK